MKILHICNMKSGIDMYVRNTIMHASDDFDFVIVHGDEDGNNPIVKNGHKVKEYCIPLYRRLNPLKDGKALLQTVQIVLKEKPDVIHCHSAKGGFIGRLAGFITGVRTLYTPHAFSFLSAESKQKQLIYRRIEQLSKLNSYLLACSESELSLGKMYVHYRPKKALVWQNALPDVDGQVLDDTVPYICYVGRPSYQKNTFFMLDVVREVHARLPEIKFYLLGAAYYSPDSDELKRRIIVYGLEDTFKLLPWKSHNETLMYIRNSLLYLTVARYEGLSLAVIEAMALSKAIVASDVVGNRDCVKDGVNGYLLPLKVDLFVEKICMLVNDVHKRMEIESQSRALFESQFLIDNRIKELETIYRQK